MCKVCGMRRTTGRDVRLRGSELKIENRAKELFQKKSDFWNTVAGDVRALLSPNAMHTHEFGEAASTPSLTSAILDAPTFNRRSRRVD